jgi:hypothetical protein
MISKPLSLSLIMGASCAFGEPIPFLEKTVQGSHNFGNHVMIYGAHEQKFVWGIVFASDTLSSISSTEVPDRHTTIKLKSGIVLAFTKNALTLTKGVKKVTMKLRPQTIYLLHADFSAKTSKDISDINLVPRRIWSRDTNNFMTTHDLVLPKNIHERFGIESF